MEIINKKLDIGYFVMILSYFNVIIDSSKYFIRLGKDYQDKLVFYDRLNQLINIKEQSNGNININNISNIKVSNLKFLYNNKIIIYDFNYEFKKNNIYCILGENGSGKSTFINLLLGIYVEQYEGNIFFNNIELRNLNLNELRLNNIGLTEQEPILIADSIINNIILNKNDFNKKLIDEYINLLNLKLFKSISDLSTNR